MTNHKVKDGEVGVSINVAGDGILLQVTDSMNASQSRAVLSIEDAYWLREELEEYITMAKNKSPIVQFYLHKGKDSEGRTLKEIWGWCDDRLEYGHDFIQWVFPLTEPSNFNSDAPLLTHDDIYCFKSNDLLQLNLIQSFKVFLGFLGLKYDEEILHVVKGDNFKEREALWKNINHNWLRITRVLKCLHTLGLQEYARRFYDCLADLRDEGYGSGNSFKFWQEAARGGK